MSQEFWDGSADAWLQFVHRGDANRVGLLDEVMLRSFGDVAGKLILDCGCGEGRFARMLTKRSASVIGIDPTIALVQQGKLNSKGVEYAIAIAEELPFQNAIFDLVASYVMLVDVPNIEAGVAEMARVLKPGGRIVASNLSPHSTALNRGWMKDKSGNKLHFPMDTYNEERGDVVEWAGIKVINYHRSLEQTLGAFLRCGLRLVEFREPVPSKRAMQDFPNLRDMARVPIFLHMVWEKS